LHCAEETLKRRAASRRNDRPLNRFRFDGLERALVAQAIPSSREGALAERQDEDEADRRRRHEANERADASHRSFALEGPDIAVNNKV